MIEPRPHHATIETGRIDGMVERCGRVVGARVTSRDAGDTVVTDDGTAHRVACLSTLVLTDNPDKPRHTGLPHSAFEYGGFDDLATSHELIEAEGITPAFVLCHGMTMSVSCRDPESNEVALQSDNFGAWRAPAARTGSSPDFAADSIGTVFDPEKVSAAYLAGEVSEALQRAPRAGGCLADVLPPGVGIVP